ncbi:HNH endonuclease signature motif containing protein [Microbacterium sp. B19]|uniref:HNH endonuclease signature motif containing protein n=1 Tax=Microbacterium sp. B19 TaxID=96765 RepID=UPI00034DE0B8|nr:HNH endonuclease signature motif containing protein [Microbacterium sp. B19]
MASLALPRRRSSTTDAGRDVPWYSDDDLQADADTAWAVGVGLLDGDERESWMAEDDATPDGGADALAGTMSALAARSQDRHRAAAAESALIRRLVDAARADPTPWVGEDPTLDPAWIDVRGRTVAAVRRDRHDMAERAVVAEIAVRLRMSEQAIRARAAETEILQRRCPNLWRAFADGNVSERHAAETARLAASLPNDSASWAEFDTGVVDRALRLTPARFVTSARALRERVHPESRETRHRRAAQDRGVWLTPELDGMAILTAFLPAAQASQVIARVDRAARHLRTRGDEERTLAQLRADAFADLMAAGFAGPGNDGERRQNRAAVVVTVPALTLLGADDAPATLDGYGPIDLDTARRLAGEATSWIRVLTHPVTGVPLALDRTRYRVPTALRRWLGITSPTCIFPGCGRAARDCDLDHLRAWAEGGPTDDDNLAPECRHHHRIRHETRWSPAVAPGGEYRWISPLGRDVDADPPPF